MSFIAKFVLLVFLFLICSLGPGYFFARKLKLSPLETFCLSISLSNLLIYLASFSIYCLNLSTSYYYFVSGIFIIVTLANLKQLRLVLVHKDVLRPILYFLVLMAWCLSLLALVRHYSGDSWAGDWIEHYERSLFFLNHMSLNKLFIGLWSLPTRPPLMNLIAAFYMGQVGDNFYIFQIIFSLLNSMVFFPSCLMAGLAALKHRHWILLLTALFMFNPLFVQNVTWTWTKMFTVFYIILGVYFYILFMQNHKSKYIILCFMNMATGCLVHFSAFPYIFFLVLHYLIINIRKRLGQWIEFSLCLLISLFILLSWFGWAVSKFGINETFFSNSTAIDYSKLNISDNFIKVARNVFNTIVPHPLRDIDITPITQISYAGYLRDYLFWIYQTNLIFAMGIVGGLLIIFLLFGLRKSDDYLTSDEKLFWKIFLPFCILTGIAVLGAKDQFGLAHICLQPIVILGLIFLSTRLWTFSRSLRIIAVLGLAVDFFLGIFLHFSLQNRVFQFRKTTAGQILIYMEDNLNFQAAANWYTKERNSLVFLGDIFQNISVPVKIFLLGFACFVLIYIGRQFINKNINITNALKTEESRGSL